MTNDLRNKLFLQLAVVVLLVIALFEGALILSLSYMFKSHIEDKLLIVSSELDLNKINNPNYLINIQRKYKLFPLIIKVSNTPLKEGFSERVVKNFNHKEGLIVLSIKRGDRFIQIETLKNDDKMEIIKTISLAISMFIYLIVLLIGYRFIDKVALNIDKAFNRLKIFNSNLSHELKTPLTIIKGEVELALKENKCDDRLLKTILNEINYINDITDKLLFLTNNINIKLSKIDLEDIVLELFEKYSSKIHIELDIEDDEFFIKGDKTLLFLSFSNLIENSIKYGANNIYLKLFKKNKEVVFILKDDGIGIPQEKLPYIFDEFYRVDEARNRKIKGFGLGLAIVKSILNLHYAKVEVKSKENEGVEFIIKFPVYK